MLSFVSILENQFKTVQFKIDPEPIPTEQLHIPILEETSEQKQNRDQPKKSARPLIQTEETC